MESRAAAEMWMNTNEEDPDTLNATHQGVSGLIAQLKAAA